MIVCMSSLRRLLIFACATVAIGVAALAAQTPPKPAAKAPAKAPAASWCCF
jgi:hypothetical protein